MNPIVEKLKSPELNSHDIWRFFSDNIVPESIKRVNEYFAFKRLAKLNRAQEPLPTDPRQLSSYRTRLGTMLEYAISTEIQKVLEEQFGDELLLTFDVAHEYPDFFLRDRKLNHILKIEMKAVDAESDEQAARFDVLTKNIDPKRDYLLIVGWEWIERTTTDEINWEHPTIFSHIFIPAIELALERDKRLIEIGGRIEGDRILVPSTKNRGTYTDDPGNYGKFWRIMTRDRRDAIDLSEHVKRFIEFQKEIDKKAPRNRF